MRDITKFKERFQRWKKTGELPYEAGRIKNADSDREELVYEDSLSLSALPAYRGGKDGIILNHDYANDVFTGAKLFDGQDIVVTGSKKNIKRSYMHPWKTIDRVRQEVFDDKVSRRRQELAALGMSNTLYNLYKNDLSKPLSPVDPVGELAVSTVALDPAFKYLFSGTGEVLKDIAYKTAGKIKPLRNALVSKEMSRNVKLAELPELELKPKIRTRLGDVEIDNPQLAYRLGDKSIVDDFLNSGEVSVPEIGYGRRNITLKNGLTIDIGKSFENPMFAQGYLWYGVPEKTGSGLLTTAEPLAVASKSSARINSEINGTFDLRYPEVGKHGRRVQLEDGQLNPFNTEAYIWEPGYGYRKVIKNPNSLDYFDVVLQRPLAALDFSDHSGRNIIEEMWYNPVLGKSKAQLLQETTPIDFDPNDMAAVLINQNTRNRIGKYLDQIVDKPTPQEVIDIFNNSVLPRVQFMRPGYRGGLMYPTVKSKVDHILSEGYTVYPKELFEKARGNDNTVGLHYPETGHIGIKEGYEDFAGGHEFRHRLDKFLTKTDTESDILEAAYDDDFLKLSSLYDDLKDVRMGPEAVTTNFDARNAAIGKYHAANTDWKLLNKIIDKLSDEKIIEAVEKSNGYGRAYIDYLRKNNKLTPTKIYQFREAMKWVGMFAGAAPLLNPSKQK